MDQNKKKSNKQEQVNDKAQDISTESTEIPKVDIPPVADTTTQNSSIESDDTPLSDEAKASLQQLAEELEQERQEQKKEPRSESDKPHYRVKDKPKTTASSQGRSDETNIPSSSETVVVKKSFSWLAFFAFIISLATASAVGFFWWQSQMWLKTQEQIEQLKKQSEATTQQNIGQLQSQLSQLQQRLQSQNRSAEQFNNDIASLTARVKELGQSQPNHWLAAEALYLVNLAERRLLVEQDIQTAIELLLAANVRLTAMKDPSVFHIRSAISEDVAALYAIVQPDSDAIYLTLSGLISQIETLPFAHVYIPDPQALEKVEEVSDNIDDWQSNIKTSISRFMGHFISVTRRDRPVGPELPADQQWFVRANLKTQLLMAQTAVLDQNNKVYQDALAQTHGWIQQYFDTSEPAVQATSITLNELMQRDVQLVLPAGLTAQSLLSNYVKAQLSLKQGIEE
jgi:uroporphyrin-3 C-methyltransferase